MLPSEYAAELSAYRTISNAGGHRVVYLDHVLYPTLTSAGKVTEVYHVNAKGEDAGVVMSEMQGVENQSSRVMAQR
jgi:Zn-dependent M16 (insulinase) family peptidase